MNKKYVGFFLGTAMVFMCFMVSGQTVYVDYGSSNTYTLQTGDSLYVSSGSFTGNINNWNQGSKVTVAVGATFSPSSVNGYKSKYSIYGSAIFPSNVQTETGFGLENYGVITINGNLQMSNDAQFLLNADIHSSITIKGSFNVYAEGSHITNYGELIMEQGFTTSPNVEVLNRSNLLVGKDLTLNGGQLQNEGYVYVRGKVTLNKNNNNTPTIINTCRLVMGENMTINDGTVYNSGLLWTEATEHNPSFTVNSGSYISLAGGILRSEKFTSYGTVRGDGFMYIIGKTVVTGTIGDAGATLDTLRVYTVNRSNPNQIFDDQWGTVHPNVIYTVFAEPNPASSSSYPCYENPMIVLSSLWEDFSVQNSGQVPVLYWTAHSEAGTQFEVQRSLDGNTFEVVTRVKSNRNSNFQYADRFLIPQSSTRIYYRIKAIKPDGKENFSEVKMVKIASPVSEAISVSPNPFNNILKIRFTAGEKGTVALMVFNSGGQLQMKKSEIVYKGENEILLTGVNGWSSGIYFLYLQTGKGTAVSTKLIKQ